VSDAADEYRDKPLVRVAAMADDWRENVAGATVARDALIIAAVAAHAAGVSEYRIAAAAGVTRGTVRAWLGKGHRD
jgi:hypothetical protein